MHMRAPTCVLHMFGSDSERRARLIVADSHLQSSWCRSFQLALHKQYLEIFSTLSPRPSARQGLECKGLAELKD